MLYINDHLERISRKDVEEAVSTLPAWRQKQALKFKHLNGQRDCALAYLELCRGLQLEYGIPGRPMFTYGQHSKPTLRDYPHIHFSLSHCNQALGCYISTAPCGLDIEALRPAKEHLVRYCLNDEECRQVFSSPNPDATFISLWTRKEAVFKLQGTGIRDNIRDILSPENTRDISIVTIPNLCRGYILSVAQYQSDINNAKIQLWK